MKRKGSGPSEEDGEAEGARRHFASLRSDLKDLQDLNINNTSLSPIVGLSRVETENKKTCLLFKWSKLLILAENVRIGKIKK